MRFRGQKYEKSQGEMGDLIVKRTLGGEPLLIHEVVRPGMTNRSRRVINKSLKDKTKPENWSSEYREHIIYQIIYRVVSPIPRKRREVARELGLSLETINAIIRTDDYHRIKNSLRAELRAKWGADIDAMVIKKALMGSKYHAELYYKLQGELIDKLKVEKDLKISTDPSSRKELIKKYLKELGMDVGYVGDEDIEKAKVNSEG